MYISKLHEGKKHDFKILEEELDGIDIFEHVIWVDLGFLGIGKKAKNEIDLAKINIPHKSSKNKPLTELQKAENKQKASKRVVIENSLAQLKIFHILKNKHRTLDTNTIETTFQICSGLANLKNRNRILNEKNAINRRNSVLASF